MPGIEEITRNGVAAVARLGNQLGLPVDDLSVLSARGNLVVHLAPAPVVARAATLPPEWDLAVLGSPAPLEPFRAARDTEPCSPSRSAERW